MLRPEEGALLTEKGKAFQEKSPFLPSRKGVVRTPSHAGLHTSGET